ncbi:MAG: Serine/threonine protein kinase [Myxococcaceae bacterium]|nr:Serine/threonine protein kinase [Myxococcaceae bacterium]
MAILEPQFHGTPRFRIVSRIGVGAVGELYKAMDETRGTFVALRTLRDVVRSAGESLRNDFTTLKGVRNPSLVTLGELDCVDGLWFYTMEFVEGEALLDYVRPRGAQRMGQAVGQGSGELSELRLRSALTQLVRAVQALHRAGRVHGNIEPEHVRVTPQGRLVLLECELSGSRDGRASEQRLLSALPFVAPERLEDAAASSASDWYSVGAILFQALVGVSPFAASGADLVEQKQTRRPELPEGRHPRELAELCRELLAIDPDARPDYEEIRARLGIVNESEARPSQTMSLVGDAAPFLGRKRELGLLAEAFERTRHGAVSTLCLYGEAGLGKRTLANQLARKLRNEYPHLVHLTGRCDPEGPRAFRGVSGVVDALSRYLAQQDASSVATLLPPHTELLTRMFPALRRIPIPETREPAPREPRALRRVALRALRTLLSDLSKRAPMLITLDNMQWADSDALSVLDELLRSAEPPNMLLLMLVHGELRAADPPLRQWLARHEDRVTLMRLKPLSDNAARELSQNLIESGGVRDPRIVARVAAQGTGHPLRIDALARHFLLTGASAPTELTLDDLLWARATHLPLEARQLLIALCHARVALPPETAAQATGLTLEAVMQQSAILRVSNLGRVLRDQDGERYAPSHSAVRHAVLARASVDRKRIHRQIALAMAAWREAPADVLATHLRDAGYEERASRATATAADQARDALAFDAAVLLYHEALSYMQSDANEERRLRTELARAYASAGQSERAARAYFEAARHASSAEALELERQAAHQLLRSGLIRDGLQTIESVLERLGMKLPRSHASALLSLARHRLELMLRGTSYETRDVSQVSPHDQLRADILGSLAAALGTIDSVRGADAQTRYLLLALKLGDSVRVARALAREAAFRVVTSEPTDDSFRPMLDRAEALAIKSGDAEAHGSALAVRAVAAFVRGATRDSMHHAAEAERILHTQCENLDWEVSNLRVLRFLAGSLVGELKVHAERVLRELRETEEYGERYAQINMLAAVGYMPPLMADDAGEALRILENAFSAFPHDGFHMQQMYYVTGMTQVDLYTREGAPYARLMAAWPQLSKSLLLRIPTVHYAMRHLRARAGIAQARTDRAERELLLRDAADSGAKLASVRVPYAVGWGHAARAGVDASRGDRERAIQRLEQAEACFYEGEMTLYAAATRYQLGRLLGSTRGRELRSHAQEWFEAQGVAKPADYINMLLPGFE